uniref:RNA polymerase II, I and III subunit F n=1 Tax=Rhinolophus ferrumequinum TaxID=59479 RepID=A0A671DSI8_RHIFE
MSDNEDNFDGDDFDDVEEDEGLDDLENAEEVSVSQSPSAAQAVKQAAQMCAPVMVELEGETDPLLIAMKELK